MNKKIIYLAKIFKEETHAEDFINGKLYANTLAYFRKIEEVENANRGDRYEGIVSWHQPEQIRVEINGRVLTDLAGPVSTSMNCQDHLNVFCVYAAHSGDFQALTKETLDAYKKQLEIPMECQKLGEHAVLITSVATFFERVKVAAKSNSFEIDAGLVEYYDPDVFHGSFSEAKSVFRKRDEYKHQKEYRFVFDTGLERGNLLILDIGDISDITMRCKVSEINKLLEVKLPESEGA